MTTTNLAQFGKKELLIASKILEAYANGKYECPYFEESGVQIMMNRNSGNVFLTNEEYQVLMLNGNKLEGFYSSPYAGHEGFIDELIENWDNSWHQEDNEWLFMLAQKFGIAIELPEELLLLITSK